MKKILAIGMIGVLALLSACSKTDKDKTITNQSSKGALAEQSLKTETPGKGLIGEKIVKVFKDPNCGCCGIWIEHIEKHGFQTNVVNQSNLTEVKQKLGISSELQSCHTGELDGYVFEGHIPAQTMQRFLEEKPDNAIGLAVPGMPIGSPGMEMGDRIQAYDVLLLKKDGTSEVYEHISTLAP